MRRAIAVVLIVLCSGVARADPPETQSDKIARLLKVVKEGQDNQRRDACDALGEMGLAARSAIPDLLDALHDRHWRGRGTVTYALMKISPGEPAVMAALDEAANDSDSEVRESVAYAQQDDAPLAVVKISIPLLVRLMQDKQVSVAIVAGHALQRLRADAAPAMKQLTDLLDSADDRRHSAAGVLGSIGPAAKDAVPKLRKLLKSTDKWDQISAAEALGKIGPAAGEAAEDLIAATSNRDMAVRVAAALALGQIGQPSSALPAFAAAIKPEDQPVRGAYELAGLQAKMLDDSVSMEKLLKTSRGNEIALRSVADELIADAGIQAVPALIKALQSKDADARGMAAISLSKLARQIDLRNDKRADDAVRRLAELLTDDEPDVRGSAGSALFSFRSPLALPALLAAVKNENWDIRSDAALALGGLANDQQSAPIAVAGLIAALNDKTPWVRHTAMRQIAYFREAAKDAVPRLIEMLRDDASTELGPEDFAKLLKRTMTAEEKESLKRLGALSKGGEVRFGVAKTLGAIGASARAAVPALIEELKRNKDRDTITALGNIGPDAQAAGPALAALLNEQPLCYYAAPALAKIGGSGGDALVKAMGDQKSHYAARDALTGGGRGVVAALARGLKSENPEIRIEVLGVLKSMGPIASDAAPAVFATITDESSAARAFDTLAALGPAATPTITEALKHSSATVRLQAAESLGRLGASAKSALPALRNLVRKDTDPEVRKAAFAAVRAIGPE